MTRYSYSINYLPIDAEGHCADDSYGVYWAWYGNLPRFIRRYEEAVYGKNASSFEHCIHNTKINVAIVHFYIDSSSNDLINKIPSENTKSVYS